MVSSIWEEVAYHIGSLLSASSFSVGDRHPMPGIMDEASRDDRGGRVRKDA
jgi:hypothetical protein